MKRLAVFDVDGTLVDSRRSIGEAMAQAFAALGLDPPAYEDTRKIVGLSLEPAIRVLAPDLDPARWPHLAEAYKQAFVRNREAGLKEPLYQGARDTVADLRARGWLIGIATGKARRGVDAFLANHDFHGWFDAAYCADDGPGKPDPHMLNLNISALAADPARTVMIGDTSFDMAMARAANVYAMGVKWGFHTEQEVAEHAHEVAADFACLSERLKRWSVAA